MATIEVVVGSKSSLKLGAVQDGFERHFKKRDLAVKGIEVHGNIPQQPVGFNQITEGALYRGYEAAKVTNVYSVGIESGLVNIETRWFDVCAVAILWGGIHSKPSLAYSSLFPIPEWAANRALGRGTELGEIIQKLSGGGEKDSQIYFSKGSVNRLTLIADAVHQTLSALLFSSRYEEPKT